MLIKSNIYILISFVFINIVLMDQSTISGQSLITPFEKDDNYSATYHEMIHHYKTLDSLYPSAQLQVIGETDAGLPLHAMVLDKKQHFKPDGRLVYFINNGIHAGEPCGIDASMMWCRDLLQKGTFSEEIVIVIIPSYNIGGMLNRNSTTRVNQLGPAEHGFRGNARNLDLNRDFIKCNSKNARSFSQFYASWKPHIFMDTHTSNGADYQHTLTLINTQPDRLPQPMQSYMRKQLLPLVYGSMKTHNWELTPYVYAPSTPDKGIYGFLDLPRYSSGYAALHHAYSFISEAHMLKPYKDRVWSTYALMDVLLEIAENNKEEILATIDSAEKKHSETNEYPIEWTLDTTRHSIINFKGYEAGEKPSEVSGLPRLYYDHDRPFEKEVIWHEYYKPVKKVSIPKAYLIPAAWYDITDRLAWNRVKIDTIEKPTNFQGESYTIISYETVDRPYEGHYLHSEVEVDLIPTEIQALPGDMLVYVDQDAWRLIMETLEPQSPDSYFAWNFMDAILQRKEHFSSYVFEDLAAEMLKEDEALKEKLTKAIEEDPSIKDKARAQLEFIYTNSKWAEKEFMAYPILRITQ